MTMVVLEYCRFPSNKKWNFEVIKWVFPRLLILHKVGSRRYYSNKLFFHEFSTYNCKINLNSDFMWISFSEIFGKTTNSIFISSKVRWTKCIWYNLDRSILSSYKTFLTSPIACDGGSMNFMCFCHNRLPQCLTTPILHMEEQIYFPLVDCKCNTGWLTVLVVLFLLKRELLVHTLVVYDSWDIR